MKKRCSKCYKTKDIFEFYTNGKYLRSACKKCEDKRTAKYKKGNKTIQKKDRIRSKERVLKAPDEYIIKLLKTKKHTKELIELKRLEIQLKRELSKWKNTNI